MGGKTAIMNQLTGLRFLVRLGIRVNRPRLLHWESTGLIDQFRDSKNSRCMLKVNEGGAKPKITLPLRLQRLIKCGRVRTSAGNR